MRQAPEAEGLAGAGNAPVHPLVAGVFDALDQTGVPWVLLRGADRLSAESGDIDLLVPPRWLAVLSGIARRGGFVEVPSPGHGTHRFFLAYDHDADLWVRLDVVTRLAFGPHQELPVLPAEPLLTQRSRRSHAWALSGSDALWALLLHYALDRDALDRALHPAKREELRAAAAQAGEDGLLARRVHELWGDDARMLRAAEAAAQGTDDELAEALCAIRQGWPRRGARRRRFVDRSRRRLSRVLPGRRGPGVSVAVLGPDGAGKSTLVDALRERLPWSTHACYIGVLRTTDLARRLRRVPGVMLLARIALFRGRYSRAAHHRRRGRVVLFDRYTYDALMPVVRSSRRGGISGAVLLRLCPPPDVTVVLDAPAAMMWERKRELSLEQLEDFRQRYVALRDRIPRVVVVDASQPADRVRRDVTELVYRTLAAGQLSAS